MLKLTPINNKHDVQTAAPSNLVKATMHIVIKDPTSRPYLRGLGGVRSSSNFGFPNVRRGVHVGR